MKTPHETVQKQSMGFTILLFITGYPPPGIEEFIKSPILRKLFYIYCLWPFATCCSFLIPHTYIFLSGDYKKLTTGEMWTLLRRYVLFLYLFCAFKCFYFKVERRAELFHHWNFVINEEKGRKLRQEILTPMLNQMSKLVSLELFGVIAFTKLPHFMVLVTGRASLYDSTLGYPHDLESPYHLSLMILHEIYMTNGAISLVAFDIMRLQLYGMMLTQLKYLKIKLSEIVKEVQPPKYEFNSSDRKAHAYYLHRVKTAEADLRAWVLDHQTTLRWCDRVQSFMAEECTLKYACIASYLALFVFSLSYMEPAASALSVAFIGGVMWLQYYGTQIADMIAETSESIAADVLAKPWWDYPISLQKSLGIILVRCQRPIEFTVMSIYPDNSVNFQGVLSFAYKVLSILQTNNVKH